MGQKVHPIGFRLGFNKTWRSRWYSEKEYAALLHEDLSLKQELKKRFSHAGVSRVDIERAANKLKISIFTSRPGIIIGRKGQEVDKLKQEVQKRTGKEVFINIQEILKPELDAQLVSESVALQLEKRIAFRRAMRKAVDAALRFGAKGIKVRVSGRLNGARSRARSGTCTDSSPCTPCAPTSTTGSPRLAPASARSGSSAGSTRVSPSRPPLGSRCKRPGD
jgi:small subunit ribosomal protein S3